MGSDNMEKEKKIKEDAQEASGKKRADNDTARGNNPEQTAAGQSAEEQKETAEQSAPDQTADSREDPEQKTAMLEAALKELNEKYLRQVAENQNTRKRLVKQQQEEWKYRHQDILRDLIDVIDNFERAIDSSTESKDFESFHQGIVMIEKQFSGMLKERYGLEKTGEEGEPFDPAAHEALMLEESEDTDTEKVKQVLQSGYRLYERVLRPAKVAVVKPAAQSAEEDKEEKTQSV